VTDALGDIGADARKRGNMNFFCWCTAVCLWRLLTSGRTVVTIRRSGIKGVRLAADLMPSSAVRDISTAALKSQSLIAVSTP
jgi:hypothetical protein